MPIPRKYFNEKPTGLPEDHIARNTLDGRWVISTPETRGVALRCHAGFMCERAVSRPSGTNYEYANTACRDAGISFLITMRRIMGYQPDWH